MPEGVCRWGRFPILDPWGALQSLVIDVVRAHGGVKTYCHIAVGGEKLFRILHQLDT